MMMTTGDEFHSFTMLHPDYTSLPLVAQTRTMVGMRGDSFKTED